MNDISRCLIREHHTNNPLFHAICWSVSRLRSDSISFSRCLADCLQEILDDKPAQHHIGWAGYYEDKIKAVNQKAIEVEQ